MTTFQSRLSFVVMTILVFIGLHFLLFNWVSSGLNMDLSLGWLELHAHASEWTIESFYPGGLIAVALVSILVTWVLSKALHHRISQQKLQTSYSLWAAFALAIFLAICLSHFWWLKDDSFFDGFVRCIRARLYDQAWETLWRACLFFGLPAIVVGWPLQALVMIVVRLAKDRLIAQPEGGANGSQSTRSETNLTRSAAGSGR